MLVNFYNSILSLMTLISILMLQINAIKLQKIMNRELRHVKKWLEANKLALRLLLVLATEHTLFRIFLNIWHQILLPGDLHDAAVENFCTTECGAFN